MGIIMYVVLYALMLQKGYQESTGKREGGREVSNGERRDLKLLPSEVSDLKPVLAPPYSTALLISTNPEILTGEGISRWEKAGRQSSERSP